LNELIYRYVKFKTVEFLFLFLY